jgi:amidase
LGLLDGLGPDLNGLLVPPDVGQTYQIAAQAGNPMITLSTGVHAATGKPFGLAVMQTKWREDELVRYGSAIEDLQWELEGNRIRRTAPRWYGYLEPVVPVRNV